jgi:MoaA/NifB/PqqE/SkfB family radical SAM enzyme
MKPRRVTHFEYDLVRVLMLGNIWWLAVKLYGNPLVALQTTKTFIMRFSDLMGGKKLVRGFKVDGKYYWDMFNPGWPSQGFNAFYTAHLLEERQTTPPRPTLRRLLVAITKRCPLQCAHCSEAATLYQKDIMTVDQYIAKIDPFVRGGIGQIVYSGGEPLSRLDDMLEVIHHYKDRCDQWIYTSAFGLTANVASQLKKAGLDGAAISLDHFDEEGHNTFRGNKKSYFWVLEGIKHLLAEGIMVSINVCPSRELVESGGVEKIIELAKSLNVPVVNILEPRAVGNFEHKDVEFHPEHMDKMRSLSERFNFDPALVDYPTVLFPAAYRASVPCGGGRSYLMLDYDGTLYPCPFCKVKMPKIATQEIQEELCLAK